MTRGSRLILIAYLTLLSACSEKTIEKSNDCKEAVALNLRADKFITTLPDSAFILATKALQLSSENCLDTKASSHQLIGKVLFKQGVYQEALNQVLKAGEYFEAVGELGKVAENLNQLGLLYYNIRQPELALKQHLKALSIYESLKNEEGIANSFGSLGRLYEKRKEYAKAFEYQQKALDLYKKTSNLVGTSIILENLGSIYEDQEQFPIALSYFRKSFELTTKTRDSSLMIINLNNIGDNYRKTGKYDSAVLWTKRALHLAIRLKDKYQLSSAYKDMSKIYGLDGKFELAYENLEIGRTIYEDMYTTDAAKQLTLFQTLFEIERKNHSIDQLEANERLNNTIKILLSISLGLIVLLAGVVISSQRLKIKKNKEVIDQNQKVFEAEKKLMAAEIENTHLYEQKLKNELETKAKSLTSHTLHIISKNKILEDIQEKLSLVLKEGPSDHRKEIKNVVKMIERNFVQDKDWDDFRMIFEQVHQDFFHELQKKASDLTASEIRLASLIRLNIPSKDIALLLGISPDSLRISRYRLRKKLNLDPDKSLTQFIASI
jgi:tetratricopeptide (TPR) repeat protein